MKLEVLCRGQERVYRRKGEGGGGGGRGLGNDVTLSTIPF